jgi:hypothetical protein
VGEHTREILAEAYSVSEIDELVARGDVYLPA